MGRAATTKASRSIHAAIDSGVDADRLLRHVRLGPQRGTASGDALKGKRDKIVLATKFGNRGGKDGKFADGRPEFVVESCDASLKRLGVEVIDLYYQHRIDPAVPIEDTVGAMKRLVEAGKVRALGLCEAEAATPSAAPTRCIRSPPCRTNSRCSIAWRPRRPCRCCSSSAFRSCPIRRSAAGCSPPAFRVRRRLPRTIRAPPPALRRQESRNQPRSASATVAAVAREKNCTPAQLALAWLLARDPGLVPIPARGAGAACGKSRRAQCEAQRCRR